MEALAILSCGLSRAQPIWLLLTNSKTSLRLSNFEVNTPSSEAALKFSLRLLWAACRGVASGYVGFGGAQTSQHYAVIPEIHAAFAVFFSHGAGFGIELLQALDAAQAQDITRAQHPSGRLSALPA